MDIQVYDEWEGSQVSDVDDETITIDGVEIRQTYATIFVPDDLYDGAMDAADQRFDYARTVADNDPDFPDWVRPCNWTLVWDHGDEVRIMRESRG